MRSETYRWPNLPAQGVLFAAGTGVLRAGTVTLKIGASGLASLCLASFCIAVSTGPCYSALNGDLCDAGLQGKSASVASDARHYANQKGAR